MHHPFKVDNGGVSRGRPVAIAVCCWLLALLGTSMALQHYFNCISIELQWHFNVTPKDTQCSFNRNSRELQQHFNITSMPPKQIFLKFRCFFLHCLRDSVSPVCGILFIFGRSHLLTREVGLTKMLPPYQIKYWSFLGSGGPCKSWQQNWNSKKKSGCQGRWRSYNGRDSV